MEMYLELSTIIVIALLVSLLMRIMRQPLIVGYIFTGILVGPYALNLIHSSEVIELFSKLGISILLFIVGLNLRPAVIREVGKVSLATGLGQVFFTSIIGFIISLFLGIERTAAMYVAIALTFSSTIIILKLLSDKGDLNKLYGRIAIGFLLVQDIVATLILLVTSSLATGESNNLVLTAIVTLLKGGVLIVAIIMISNYVLPRLSHFIAASQELLFLFSISWGLGMGALFTYLGFSVEIGALVAGVTLSMTPYAYEAASRLRPLRDFFIVLFFILLGSQMVLSDMGKLLVPALILSFYVLIGNPTIMIVIMNLLGFSKRTSYQAALTVGQISEFSLILATLGFQIGHLSREVLSLITLVGLITISGSTYLILYSDKLYPYIEKMLSYLELKKNKKEEGRDRHYSSILFGYQRVGEDFIESFDRIGLRYVVIDFNPDSISALKDKNIPHIFGDAADPEFLEELHLHTIKYVVSTIPDINVNKLIVKKIREKNNHAIVIMIAQNREESLDLYEAGATYVILPHYLGAQYAARMIGKHGLERSEYEDLREKHLSYLEKRTI
ncbi:cation:proton antiporter [Candidatus Woesebacteria bacterium]|nr:cation:proton antiporter [Candidatus Woesebacteria bacterium]